MLIAKAIVKKMGLQGRFSEDFEDKPMGSDCWGVVLSGRKRVGPKILSVNILIFKEGKRICTKIGVRYPVQMFEDIKGVLDASTEMSNNFKRMSA